MVGIVIGISFNGEMIVDFLPGTDNSPYIQKFNASDLVSEDEANIELSKLEAEHNKLNNEFETIRKEIALKLTKAAELVKDAGMMLVNHDKTAYDLMEEFKPLINEIGKTGWTPSNIDCGYVNDPS